MNKIVKKTTAYFIEFVIFSLFAMQLEYCNIQRVYDQR